MKKVDYEHFSRFKMPHSLKVKGEDIYFCVKEADMEENTYKNDLYVYKNKKVKRMTALGDTGAFSLFEDGIVFAAARTNKEKEDAKKKAPKTVFYKLPYDGGEAVPFITLPFSAASLIEYKNRLFFAASENAAWNRVLSECGGDTEKAEKLMAEDDDYHEVDEIPFYYNGAGFTNGIRGRVYAFSEGEYLPLSPENTDSRILSSSNGKLLIASLSFEKGKAAMYERLLCVDMDTLACEDITEAETAVHFGAWALPDGKIVSETGICREYGMNQNASLCIKTDKWEIVYDGGMCAFDNSVGSDIKGGGKLYGFDMPLKDGAVLFLDTVNAHTAVSKIDLSSGEVSRITDNEMNICCLDFYGDGYVVIAAEGNSGFELFTVTENGKTERISELNTALCDEYAYSLPVHLTFENEKGEQLDGWVMKPFGYEKGTKYPAILDIHGGPKTVYGSCYFHEMQLWASMGYFVFFCNPTGGDGRGNEFADIREKYGDIEFRDIMKFTDTVLAEYEDIDKERVGVTGGSYGGFMTNWIIGHTGRFAAAASQRSISNWLSFYNTSDIGFYFAADQTGGTPWNETEKLWNASPLKYADKVTTPTLFIHSEEDFRCPLYEGIQMFTAIKDHGVDARMCIFKGENHELSRSGKPKHRVKRLKEITAWFEKYLKA